MGAGAFQSQPAGDRQAGIGLQGLQQSAHQGGVAVRCFDENLRLALPQRELLQLAQAGYALRAIAGNIAHKGKVLAIESTGGQR